VAPQLIKRRQAQQNPRQQSQRTLIMSRAKADTSETFVFLQTMIIYHTCNAKE
jgi:hypothetical protein